MRKAIDKIDSLKSESSLQNWEAIDFRTVAESSRKKKPIKLGEMYRSNFNSGGSLSPSRSTIRSMTLTTLGTQSSET